MADQAPATFRITRQWLQAHSTPGGGFTAQQLAVFDVPWPPVKGWASALYGLECSLEQKAEFERLYRERQEYRRENGMTWEARERRKKEQQDRIRAAPLGAPSNAAPAVHVTVIVNGKEQ